jgi:hypothetical protein
LFQVLQERADTVVHLRHAGPYFLLHPATYDRGKRHFDEGQRILYCAKAMKAAPGTNGEKSSFAWRRAGPSELI